MALKHTSLCQIANRIQTIKDPHFLESFPRNLGRKGEVFTPECRVNFHDIHLLQIFQKVQMTMDGQPLHDFEKSFHLYNKTYIVDI